MSKTKAIVIFLIVLIAGFIIMENSLIGKNIWCYSCPFDLLSLYDECWAVCLSAHGCFDFTPLSPGYCADSISGVCFHITIIICEKDKKRRYGTHSESFCDECSNM